MWYLKILRPGETIVRIETCHGCRVWVAVEGGAYSVLLDESSLTRAAASRDAWLSLAVVGLLLVMLQVDRLILQAVLQPLHRMLASIHQEAKHVLQSLEHPQVCPACWKPMLKFSSPQSSISHKTEGTLLMNTY